MRGRACCQYPYGMLFLAIRFLRAKLRPSRLQPNRPGVGDCGEVARTRYPMAKPVPNSRAWTFCLADVLGQISPFLTVRGGHLPRSCDCAQSLRRCHLDRAGALSSASPRQRLRGPPRAPSGFLRPPSNKKASRCWGGS
jgi:hypothetical protein